MKESRFVNRTRYNALRAGASVVALTVVVGAMAVPAHSQTAAATDVAAAKSDTQEVVVVGVRKSLKTAQQTKKDADTVVDSITASDIGAFPDKSVAEALERVPGITVTRFAATADTAHFSAEPSGVLIRGLTEVRSEFNGRDTFSADSSRGLSWGDISPELMAGVDTYKNQTADMIEGGIAGSINLRTRLPFDSKGQVLALSATANYGDLSKKWTPDYSGLYSNTFATQFGEFGVMADYAHSYVETETDGIQYGRWGTFCSSSPATNSDGTVKLASDGSVPCTSGSPYGTPSWAYVPASIAYHQTVYDRYRDGVAFAGQWRNNEHTMLATLQYNDSKYHNEWNEHVLTGDAYALWAAPSYDPINSVQAQARVGTPAFTFDGNGQFESGDMVAPLAGYGGSDAASALIGHNTAGQPIVCQSSACIAQGQTGSDLFTETRFSDTREDTRDLSFNFKWDVTSKIHTNFDVQYVAATESNHDQDVDSDTFADLQLNLSGKYPTMAIENPIGVNLSPGGTANPNNYYYRDAQDHVDQSQGTEFATRLDGTYDFNGNWVDSLKIGVRYSDREQHIKWSAYNWGNIVNNWTNNASYFNADSPAYPAGMTQVSGFSNFFGGNVLPGNPQFMWLKNSVIDSVQAVQNGFSAPAIGVGGWDSTCQRANDIPGSCYTQSEVSAVSERTMAGYAELKFGGHEATIFNGITVQGNTGVRWVQTEDETSGYVTYPTSAWWQSLAAGPACNAPLTGSSVTNISCWITPQVQAFSNGAGSGMTSHKDHINWLPSFNVRFGLNDNWFLRFGASRSLSRPDMGYLKNYVQLNSPVVDTSNASTSVVYNSPTAAHTAANVTGYNFLYTASAGNPYLKPITADNYDISLEDYFASVGSFTMDFFYKKFYNYIQFGQYDLNLTNNGVTAPVQVSGPINAGGATVKGFELAYQTFFTSLPGPWDGLGVQANYTHVVDSGVNNTNITDVSGDGGTNVNGGGVAQATGVINPHSLEGLSRDAYNLVGMYEKGRWAARLAYNYRSTFLVTALDCCVGLPVWQKGYGQLDGSLKYKIDDHIELNLEGSNLTGSDTRLLEQVFGDTPQTPGAKAVFVPNAYFKNDRRIQLGIRLRY